VINLTIVARSLAIRTGLRALLEASAEIEVVAEAASLEELGVLSPTTDVLIFVMGISELEDLPEFLRENAHLPVLLLVEIDDFGKIPKDTLAYRAWGMLSLDATGEELVSAISALFHGLWVSDPVFVDPLLTRQASLQINDEETLIDPLTNRELEVLQLIAQGLPNKQIAVHLGISEHTIKFHISAIYAKLGASNRTEAVRVGVRLGLILL
jgi:DNA-binding NarL/FixJ family response regulator